MTRKRNKNATCYMCGENARSKEHVPPKAFFPGNSGKNYRNNLITVPSCDLHNLGKSNDDEYILFVLSSAFRTNKVAEDLFGNKVMKALARNPALVSHFNNAYEVSVGNKKTMGFHIDRDRFDKAISAIAMALYFHDFRDKWIGQFFVYSPDIFSVVSEDVNKTIQDLEHKTGDLMSKQSFAGENPEIFRYKLHRKDNWYLARMLFYQGVVVNAFSEKNLFL